MMKQKIFAAAVAALFLMTGTSVFGAGKTSVESGMEMFNDSELGSSSNESSCNSCHAGGKGLENAGEKKKLSKLVNKCLVGQMAGEKIDGRMAAMRSLKMYIKSLNN
jgi:cytochrome c peroxidase